MLVFAEREGFEPPVHCCTMVFKTTAFDHSTISPIADCKKIDLDICKAKTLSGNFYTSKSYFNDSIEKIFARSWQFISDDTMLQQDREAQPFQLNH